MTADATAAPMPNEATAPADTPGSACLKLADSAKPSPAKPVERLFPFVLRSRGLIVGRESLRRSRSKLHCVLITCDISEASRAEILSDFAPYPIVQQFTGDDLERFFGIRGAKVIGFAKSGLAQSIYAELKAHRINPPAVKPTAATPPARPATSLSTAPRPLPPKHRETARPPAGRSDPRRLSAHRPRKARNPKWHRG